MKHHRGARRESPFRSGPEGGAFLIFPADTQAPLGGAGPRRLAPVSGVAARSPAVPEELLEVVIVDPTAAVAVRGVD